MYLPEKKLISELRKDIRTEIHKQSGQKSGGGDFYQPIWHDIKQHVLGKTDLSEATKRRIEANEKRRNLYPRLEEGFLKLWKRGDNQKVDIIDRTPKGRYVTPQGHLTIKVENVMAVSIDGNERLGYPYWFSDPALSEESARVGLWIMEQALKNENENHMRIFDIIRSEYYSLQNTPLNGDEEQILLSNFQKITNLREKLILEYPAHYSQEGEYKNTA